MVGLGLLVSLHWHRHWRWFLVVHLVAACRRVADGRVKPGHDEFVMDPWQGCNKR